MIHHHIRINTRTDPNPSHRKCKELLDHIDRDHIQAIDPLDRLIEKIESLQILMFTRSLRRGENRDRLHNNNFILLGGLALDRLIMNLHMDVIFQIGMVIIIEAETDPALKHLHFLLTCEISNNPNDHGRHNNEGALEVDLPNCHIIVPNHLCLQDVKEIEGQRDLEKERDHHHLIEVDRKTETD